MSNIPWWSPQIGPHELGLVKEVLESGYINEGEVTARFERQIAELVGAKHAVATTSGTTAIFLALAARGIGHGDEVIVPDVTFIATANAVTLTGATPVLVDVDPRTLNIEPSAFERAVTSRTKAVVPVHVTGRGADMKAVCAIAKKHGLVVVEDAAEALRSKHEGRWLGTWGDAGCFSFSPNKTITSGQGGMIVTDDDALAQRVRELKDQGRPVRGTGGDDLHPSLGFNFKLTNLQSAVALGQLRYLEERLARQRRIYELYAKGLAGVRGIEVIRFDIEGGACPQWTDVLCDRRDALEEHLRARGASTRKFWFPLHTQAPYRLADDAFPTATAATKRALWLPSAFTLSDDDVRKVVEHVRSFYEEKSR
ncbi:MAG TPA: DegT/DnrJ/EryC1/StrS family aminotransferase [Labilithrix sp.]|nr:DegT/DnrJ/EryC1/StrS family aminotransferase [Labilithrix sp.]